MSVHGSVAQGDALRGTRGGLLSPAQPAARRCVRTQESPCIEIIQFVYLLNSIGMVPSESQQKEE